MHENKPNRAQAESIGTVLLVAIVVVSATTFGAYYVSSQTGGSAGGAAGSAGGAGGTPVDIVMTASNDSLTLSHNGGRSLSTESLRVSVANASGDFSYTFSDGEIRGGGGANEQFDPGETWEINWTQSAGSEVTVSVIDDATDTLLLQETTTIGSATESDTGGSAGGTEPAEPTFSVDAGPDRTVSGEADSTVGLDGSATAEDLTYQWEIVEDDGLSSDAISIADDQSPDATFEVRKNITDRDHTVVVELTAENGTVSASDQTTVRIEKFNRPPVADAGKDQTVGEEDSDEGGRGPPDDAGPPENDEKGPGSLIAHQVPHVAVVYPVSIESVPVSADMDDDGVTTVELNGSGSYDPDPGDELTYEWQVTDYGGISDRAVNLTRSESVKPVVIFSSLPDDEQRTITVELTVTDPSGERDTDQVNVTVSSEVEEDRTENDEDLVDWIFEWIFGDRDSRRDGEGDDGEDRGLLGGLFELLGRD